MARRKEFEHPNAFDIYTLLYKFNIIPNSAHINYAHPFPSLYAPVALAWPNTPGSLVQPEYNWKLMNWEMMRRLNVIEITVMKQPACHKFKAIGQNIILDPFTYTEII